MSKCSMYSPAATPVCWYSGLTPRKPTRTRVIVFARAAGSATSRTEDPAAHPLQRLVDVGDGDRHPDALPGVDLLGDHEPVLSKTSCSSWP